MIRQRNGNYHLNKIETASKSLAVIVGLLEKPVKPKMSFKKYVDKGRYLKDCSLSLDFET